MNSIPAAPWPLHPSILDITILVDSRHRRVHQWKCANASILLCSYQKLQYKRLMKHTFCHSLFFTLSWSWSWSCSRWWSGSRRQWWTEFLNFFFCESYSVAWVVLGTIRSKNCNFTTEIMNSYQVICDFEIFMSAYLYLPKFSDLKFLFRSK